MSIPINKVREIPFRNYLTKNDRAIQKAILDNGLTVKEIVRSAFMWTWVVVDSGHLYLHDKSHGGGGVFTRTRFSNSDRELPQFFFSSDFIKSDAMVRAAFAERGLQVEEIERKADGAIAVLVSSGDLYNRGRDGWWSVLDDTALKLKAA